MSRKKKDRDYYGVNQEAAVVAFLNAKTLTEKELIYREHLREPINKMIESIIRTYKLYRQSYEFNDLHADTLSFLMTKFEKFNPERGNKSFSYFGTVCKNYLYNEMMKEYKKNTFFSSSEEYDKDISERDDLSYTIDNENPDLNALIINLTDAIRADIIELDVSTNEYKVGYAVLKILEDWENLLYPPLDNKVSKKFNKNLVLLYIRDMTSLTTKEIRNGLKRYKSLYFLFKKNYL